MAKPGRPWVLRQFSLLRTSIALRLFVTGALGYICLPPLVFSVLWKRVENSIDGPFPSTGATVVLPVVLLYVALPSLIIAIALWANAHWAGNARFIQNALTPLLGLFVLTLISKYVAEHRELLYGSIIILPFLVDETLLTLAWVIRTVKRT